MLNEKKLVSFATFLMKTYMIGAFMWILLLWAPHYVVWPTFQDWDMPAKLALWDLNGLKPYMHTKAGPIGPGQIYIWKLAFLIGGLNYGKVVANTIDVSMVVSIALVALYWSKKQFLCYIPGMIIGLGWLWRYASLEVTVVAQRDWHCIYFIVISLMILQANATRRSFLISAIIFAISAMFRPYTVFAIPAMLFSVYNNSQIMNSNATHKIQDRLKPMIIWSISCLLFFFLINLCLLPFESLMIHLKSLFQFINSSGYKNNPVTLVQTLQRFVYAFSHGWNLFLPTVIMILIYFERNDPVVIRTRNMIFTWLLLGLGTIVWKSAYKAHEPIFYIQIPNLLLQIILIGLIAGMIRNLYHIPEQLRLVFSIILLSLVVQTRPIYVSLSDSIHATKLMISGTTTYYPKCQGGLWEGMIGPEQPILAILDTLKQQGPQTRLFNLMVGTTPSFTADSGLMDANPSCSFTVDACYGMLEMVSADEVLSEIEGLKNNVVVIWTPHAESYSTTKNDKVAILSPIELNKRKRMEVLRNYVRKNFRPMSTFSEIEIWKKKE